jgi:hypothetical protein
MTDPLPDSPFYATLVVNEAITKPDALAAIARALGAPIQRSGTSGAFVALDGDAWAEVDIPKFGEAPPLAIDVYSALSRDDAETAATALMARLATGTDWRIRPMFTR